jgi:hypothetical protein
VEEARRPQVRTPRRGGQRRRLERRASRVAPRVGGFKGR